MREIKKIVVHCSDSPQGRGDDAATIHRWHKQKGYDGIGYHYVITEDGDIHRGRPDYWDGAHVKGHNSDSIGICLIGKDSFTENQNRSLAYLICKKKIEYRGAKVFGHKDLDSNKTCPNFCVRKVLREYTDLFRF